MKKRMTLCGRCYISLKTEIKFKQPMFTTSNIKCGFCNVCNKKSIVEIYEPEEVEDFEANDCNGE
jgi:hypothetical protein